LNATGNVKRDQSPQAVGSAAENCSRDKRNIQLLGERFEQGVFVDKPELEELGAEPPTAVMAGLEPGVELGDSYRSAFQKDFLGVLWSCGLVVLWS
jgi:hypothetical protein